MEHCLCFFFNLLQLDTVDVLHDKGKVLAGHV